MTPDEVICTYQTAGFVPIGTHTFSCNGSTPGTMHSASHDYWVLRMAGPAQSVSGRMSCAAPALAAVRLHVASREADLYRQFSDKT